MKDFKSSKFALFLIFILGAPFESLSHAKALQLGSATINQGLLQSILAKELCSCIYVQRLDIGHYDLSEEEKVPYRFEECLERSALPISPSILKSIISMKPINANGKAPLFSASSTPLGRLFALRVNSKNQRAIAVYLGEKKGCRLLTDEEINQKKVFIY